MRAVIKEMVVTVEACQCLASMLCRILLVGLTPCVKVVVDHPCGIQRNTATKGHIFCIRQILGKSLNCVRQCISYL
jgi:hypothetical protein